MAMFNADLLPAAVLRLYEFSFLTHSSTARLIEGILKRDRQVENLCRRRDRLAFRAHLAEIAPQLDN